MTRWRLRWTIPFLALALLSSRAWAVTGTWESNPGVAGRTNPTMIYDSLNQRLVMFGGHDGGQLRGDTWQLYLPYSAGGWSKMLFSTEPAPRTGHTAVYDPSHRMIVFGGLVAGDVFTNEVWSLSTDSGGWQPLTTTGTVPPGTAWHTAVVGFDPSIGHYKMYVYGGQTQAGTSSNTYALDLATLVWQPVNTTINARKLRYHAAAIDAPMQYMYVFGGEDVVGSTATVVRNVWRLDLITGTWFQITFGPNATQPPPTKNCQAVYDFYDRRELVIFGGTSPGALTANETIYRLSVDNPTTWTILPATGGVGRERHGAAFDPVQHRLWVYGGTEGPPSRQGGGPITPSDTWLVSLVPNPTPAWTPLDVRPYPGSAFSEHTLVYDSINARPILFGGMVNNAFKNTLFVQGLPGAAETWTTPSATGTPPAPRAGHTAIFDYANQRMLVFGGYGNGVVFGDITALDTSGGNYAWSPVQVSGGPGPREGHSAIYADQVASNRRMIVFAGSNGSALNNEVWGLSLNGSPAWQQITTSNPKPAPRRDHTAVYDTINNRMFVYGGTKENDTAPTDELWMLELNNCSPNCNWTKINLSAPKPPARANHVAVFSPYIDQRMLIFGGMGPSGSQLRDAWVLDTGFAPLGWKQFSFTAGPTPAERDSAAAANFGFGRVLITGGNWDDFAPPNFEQNLENFNDTWILNFNPGDP